MYTFNHRRDIVSEEEMLAFLKSLQPVNPNSPIAIVGGHYMLFYDKQEDCLKPLIYQDLKDEKHIAFARLMAGDFPTKTFVYALKLITHFLSKGIESKNVLLVNDHLFQSKKFQPNIQYLIENRGGELRYEYYRGKNSLPLSFVNRPSNFKNIKKNMVFLDNDDLSRDVRSVLPKKTVFFSEQFLRNRFENHLKKRIVNNSYVIVDTSCGKNVLYYTDKNKRICLTENGQCGCSSEIMEFIWILKSKGYNDIIMFIPSECENQVNNGVEVTLKLFKYEFESESRVIIITGLGGMGENHLNDTPRVFEHSNSPSYGR